MWIDADDEGCPSCTTAADLTFTERDRALLNAKDVTFACVSRAPYASIARYRDEHGWTFPWYSSRDSDFTYDYHVTLDPTRAPIEYNYKWLDELHADGWTDDDLRGDWPGASVFLRRGDEVFHTYSAYRARTRPLRRRLSVPGSDAVRPAGDLGGLACGLATGSVAAGVPMRDSSDHAERKAGPVPGRPGMVMFRRGCG